MWLRDSLFYIYNNNVDVLILTSRNKLFKEKVSVKLKIEFVVVCILFSLKYGFNNQLGGTTCWQLLKVHFSTHKMLDFLIQQAADVNQEIVWLQSYLSNSLLSHESYSL